MNCARNCGNTYEPCGQTRNGDGSKSEKYLPAYKNPGMLGALLSRKYKDNDFPNIDDAVFSTLEPCDFYKKLVLWYT